MNNEDYYKCQFREKIITTQKVFAKGGVYK
jgi:hypothetical protein